MDPSQWLEHAISLVFGGAGGIAAGLARLSSSLSALTSKQDALDKRQEVLERRIDALSVQSQATSQQLAEMQRQHERQIEDLKRQVTGQLELSHTMLHDKLDELHIDMGAMRSATIDQQTDLQRSLGSVEGTLKMIARNGCARACMNDRASIPDVFPSEPPTKNRR
jgi:chromosome segregation ATPase